jgi:signal transduction histidine kinase
LVARDRTIGAMSLFHAESGRRYVEAQIGLALELGRRAGIAIDNARLYDQAQRAVEARDRVLAVVSHDLRSPLNTVVLGASAIQNTAATRSDGRSLVKQAEIILRSTHRMTRLLEDLLDFASLERGHLQLDLAPHDAGSILREALESHAAAAHERGVELSGETPPAAPLRCDRSRILQVLDNLLANALSVAPRGTAIRLTLEEGPAAVRFSVADRGPGIPPEHLARIFDRYWRPESTEYKGRGLGLAIAKGIVEGHGGTIWAETSAGNGSTFRFELPR